MSISKNILAEFESMPENTLINASKLYREKFDNIMSETAFMQNISRMNKKGKIVRISKGIYCRPKMTKYGNVLPSDKEIAVQYTGATKGMIVGYYLYNSLNITTQISKTITVFSSISDEQVKRIGNVVIYKYNLKFTDSIMSIIKLMELLYNFKNIQDLNHKAFLNSVEFFSNAYTNKKFETVQNAITYPKWTIAFLKALLDHYQVSNDLNKYLSSLSEYKYPRIEELYESAH